MPSRSNAELRFPYKGINEGFAYHGQRPDTSVDLKNVRSFDPLSGRSRGSQRAGLTKYLTAQHTSGSKLFQCIFSAIQGQDAAYTATTLPVREHKRIGIAGGTFQTFTPSAWATPTGSITIDSAAPYIAATQVFGVIYFVDGSNYNKYTMTTDTLATWAASPGTLPTDGGHEARLACTWRGRVVLGGIPTDASNWFMSAVGNPLDYDYSPATVVETQAVAGTSAEAGKFGDVVNCLIPYSDDILIMGGDHSIEMFRDDPMAGGRIDQITDVVGMAFGAPWCRDPIGRIYFYGSRGGIYRMAPGGQPERITSEAIDERLAEVSVANTIISAAWDDRTQGCHFFVTPLTAAATTHYYWDARNEAWFIDSFTNTNFDPGAALLFDGDTEADRHILLGGRDGRIRKIDVDAKDDDGEAIESYVILGPINQQGGAGQQLKDITFVLDDESSPVEFEVYAGNSEEHALNQDPVYRAMVYPGRNPVIRPNVRGHAIYLKLMNNEVAQQWSYEYSVAGLEVYQGVGRRVFTT